MVEFSNMNYFLRIIQKILQKNLSLGLQKIYIFYFFFQNDLMKKIAILIVFGRRWLLVKGPFHHKFRIPTIGINMVCWFSNELTQIWIA